MTADWMEALLLHRQTATPCVLVTVTAARGSTPREAGAKMVVTADGLCGTIGGGRLEHESTAAARALLAEPCAAPLMRDFPLGPALGQCCGGHASVLFEPMQPPGWHVAVFGAGHVGRALVRLLADLPCRVRWVDDRADAFPDTIPANVSRVQTARPEIEIAALPARAAAVVMTHDHGLDYRLVAALLRRRDLGFVGLIGSATKRARFAARLRAEGVADGALTCPIGVPGAGGKLPAEIAISVAAQLLQQRDAVPLAVPAVEAMIGGVRDNVVALRGCGSCEGCAG